MSGRNVAFLGSDGKSNFLPNAKLLPDDLAERTPYTVIGNEGEGTEFQLRWRGRAESFHPVQFQRRDFPNKPPALGHSVDRLLVAPGRWRRILIV